MKYAATLGLGVMLSSSLALAAPMKLVDQEMEEITAGIELPSIEIGGINIGIGVANSATIANGVVVPIAVAPGGTATTTGTVIPTIVETTILDIFGGL